MYVVGAFTLNGSFYQRISAVHPVSVLILQPREIQVLVLKTVKQRNDQA